MASPAAPSTPAPANAADRSGWRALAADLCGAPYRRAAAWAIPVLLLAYGFALANFTLAGDDWFAVYPEATLDTDYLLWAGRWVTPLLSPLTGNGAFVPAFTLAVGLALLVAAGLVAASAWRLTRSWPVFAVVALTVSSPLFTDKLNFKQAHITSPLAIVAAAAAGWLLLRWSGSRGWRVAAAAGLLAWTLATYQPTALFFAVVVLGGEVRRGVADGGRYWREAWPRWLEVAAAVALGVAIYALSVRVAWWVTGTDPSRAPAEYSLLGGYPSSLGQWADTAGYGLRTVGRFWARTTALYPVVLKAIGLALIGAGALAAAALSGRRGPSGEAARWATRAWLLFLGAVSVVLPFAVLFLRADPPLRANAFVAVGLVTGLWAGLLLEHLGEGRPARRHRPAFAAVAFAVALVVAGGAFQTAKGFVGLHLGNQRDLANANRMLSVMEQMPGFARGAEIQVHLVGRVRFSVPGAPFSYEVAGTPATSIVNCSGLACQKRLVQMLNLIGGGDRPFVARRAAAGREAKEAMAAMPSWPEPGSIRYLEGVFVVKGS